MRRDKKERGFSRTPNRDLPRRACRIPQGRKPGRVPTFSAAQNDDLFSWIFFSKNN